MKNFFIFPSLEQGDISEQKPLFSNHHLQPTVALLHCYDLIDDFLDSINISFETFCNEFVGSWMFGYIDALQKVGVRTVLFCISARVEEVSRFTHKPTGATICVLPTSWMYRIFRKVRRRSLNLYGASDSQSFKDIQDENLLRRSFLSPIKDLAKSLGSYLSTPLNLLARELRRENCQAILCQEYEYARFDACVLLGKFMRLPVFATFQGGDRTQSWLESPLRQLAFQACRGVIIATQIEIQRVCDRYQVPISKVARIFNPLEVSSWQPINRQQARVKLNIPLNAKVVVWHGRVEIERKGLDILLKAWQHLCDKHPQEDLKLLVIGTGSDAERFHQSLDRMQLQGVTWLNEFVSDRTVLQTYLCAADVFAFPSRQEGFPVAPIEAMSCSLPVVAADAPGVPDIFERGEVYGGVIVPRENTMALAVALDEILEDRQRGLQMGLRARDRAMTSFASEVIGEQLKDVLFG
ncbi:glycosyltransferase family 4 protein [Scytonema sp. NUACC26]|uniref:glycosyltransferase family 4 protein n=1 Tax=Scytonema sp. NUACC26 TaxID=3140176 RepID=UPI0034DBE280